MSDVAIAEAAADELQGRTDALHDAAVVCDLTLPWGPGYANQDTVLARFRQSGIDFVSLTIGLDRMSLEQTIRHIAAERARFAALEPEGYVLAESVEDILKAKHAGKLAVGFHFQGSNPLAGDPKMVGLYYRLGVRHMLFAYNQRNMAADGCHEDTDCGLSRYGRALVREMNRVGMIVDCTHTGHRSTMDIVELSADPAGTLAKVLDALGLPREAASGVTPGTARLADATSAVWADRLRAELAADREGTA